MRDTYTSPLLEDIASITSVLKEFFTIMRQAEDTYGDLADLVGVGMRLVNGVDRELISIAKILESEFGLIEIEHERVSRYYSPWDQPIRVIVKAKQEK